MLLRELFEKSVLTEENKHVTFAFGRMNPPHYGHKGLIDLVSKTAGNDDWYIFVSKSHDPKKNPLTYDQKLAWIYALYPEVKGHLVEDPAVKTYLQAASYLYNKGYTSATFVAGEDDLAQMKSPLETYNDAELDKKGNPLSHGHYKFEPLDFLQSPRLTSATNARTAAQNNNEEEFTKATNVDPKITVNGKNLFQTVRQGMGLENQDVQEGYGRYWCSTDKKWKERKGPKQTRKS